MKALVVEDEFISRKMLTSLLSPFFEVETVVNGAEAIEAYILSRENNNPYQVILMDIMMPEVDGLTALDQIRKYEKDYNINPQVKVIMTTALNDPKTIIKSFHDAKASSYIVKPITKEKLYQELEKLNIIKN